jgi:hypothetical protein
MEAYTMKTSFEVGAVFRVIDEASPALRTILRSITRLDKAVAATEKSLTSLGRAFVRAALDLGQKGLLAANRARYMARAFDRSPIGFRSPGPLSALCSQGLFQGAIMLPVT